MANQGEGIVGVIRTQNSEHAYLVAKAWAATPISKIEITLTVPNAVATIKRLVDEGVTRIGGGTVRTVDQVRELKKAGAQFVVSPISNERVIKETVNLGMEATPGILTPTEAINAIEWGASSVKIFPINSVGGSDYVRYILEPLPDLKIVVSGGVKTSEVREYLDLGCVGVCLGGALWREETAASGDVNKLINEAKEALSKI